MKFRTVAALLSGACLLMMATAPNAQPRIQKPPQQQGGGGGGGGGGGMIQRVTPEMVQQALQAAGWTDLSFFTMNNQRHVRGKTEDTIVNVIMYNCEGGGCLSFNYYAFWEKLEGIDAAWANSFNSEKRFAKAYITKEGNFAFDMDVVAANVSPAYIVESAKLYGAMLKVMFEYQPS